MAEVLGPMTLLNKALPSTGVDAGRLAAWALRGGISYPELANRLALALGDVNQRMVDKWGWLFSFTEEPAMFYSQGGTVTPMPEITEVDKPEPIHGTLLGHMLPFRHYGRGIGGTKYYFRDAPVAQINAALGVLVNQGEWRFEQGLLTRFFTNTEEAIGAGGYSVPFVRGSGGNVDYIPPAWDGGTFAATHDHFIGYNATTPLTMMHVLNGLAATLTEHGHEPPFRALVSAADRALFTALTSFVQMINIPNLIINRGGATTGAQFYRTGQDTEFGHFGDFQSTSGFVELWASNRIPTGYVGMTKTYGQLDSRNALAVRLHPSRGFGMMVVPETTPDDDWPVKQLDVDFEYGVGVGGDRTNGAVGYLVAGGTYANATIS